ncbi:MAG TPA: condensation domain-containing protein [Steroidobacteraceae bacterium]|nr:condensation domain-containing protein [Steroidobacteraceae bacterium]
MQTLHPLTSAQQSIWLDQIANPHSTQYSTAGLMDIDGPLDVKLFEQAVTHVSEIHDALRIVLHEQPGVPAQSVLPCAGVRLTQLDVSGHDDAEARARAYLHEIFNTPFDMYGGPLWRSHLVRVSETRHLWLQTYHHLVVDGVSSTLLYNHVFAAYNRLKRGEPLPTEPERSCLEVVTEDLLYRQSERHQRDLDFWSQRFAEMPPLLIKAPEVQSRHPARKTDQVVWSMPRAMLGQITEFSAARGLSLTQFMMALVCAYFARANDIAEVVFGLSVHNRGGARHKTTIGMFASVVPLAITVDRTRSFVDLMESASRELRACYRHQRVSAADLHRHLMLAKSGRQRIFDVFLSVENFFEELVPDGTTVQFSQPPHDFSQAPLGIHVHDWVQAVDVPIDFDFWMDSLTRDSVVLMRDRMERIVTAVLSDPDVAIDDIPFVSDEEGDRIVGFCEGMPETRNRDCFIHELFEAQVEKSPGALAVTDGSLQLTYGELNERANQLAHYLVAQGAGPDRLVTLYIERGIELVVSMLGVLKAGAAYVPIEAGTPAQRVA